MLAFGVWACLQAPMARAADDPDSTVRKFSKITQLFRKEGYRPPSELYGQGASQELRRELSSRGLNQDFLDKTASLESQLREACIRYPDLCSDGTLLAACVHGMAEKMGDHYAAYLPPTAFSGMMRRVGGQEMAGPGVYVVKDHPSEPIEVLEATADSPAAMAKLAAGDKVLEIDGCPTNNLAIDEARSRIQGAAGTDLDLTVQRVHQTQPEHVKLRRITLDNRTVQERMLRNAGKPVGYVRIKSFGSQTPHELKDALKNLTAAGASGLVVDLRNNGGGLVWSAVDVCSNFLPEGSRVVSIDRRAQSEVHKAVAGPRTPLPLVVLINQNSASSAEITAGAIRDAGVGLLVGTKSFGKGTVQCFLPLGDGSALKLTTAHYRTPQGREIHGIGIVPDVVVDKPVDSIGNAQDPQLARALELVEGQMARVGQGAAVKAIP